MTEPEKTRAQLQTENVELQTLIRSMNERLKAIEEKPKQDANALLLTAAIKELQENNPAASRRIERPKGSEPEYVPYKGEVRAKVLCHYLGIREKNSLFMVDVPVLWSDDPYEPVTVTRRTEEVTDENGQVMGENQVVEKVVRRTDVPVIDFRWRRIENTSDVMIRAM